MRNVEHIFFDLDHTIWDFDRNSTETLGEIFDEFNIEEQGVNKERFIATYRTVNGQYWKRYRDGKIDKQMVRFGRFTDTLKRLKVANHESLGKRIGDLYVERGPHKTNLFEGAHEALRYLADHYPLHIITNGFKEVQHIKLSGSDLTQYFDVILCSEDVGVNKPNRKVFDRALALAKAAPSNSLMIGDNWEADVQGAQNVGMKAIHFDPERSSNAREENEDFRVIHSLLQLKEIL